MPPHSGIPDHVYRFLLDHIVSVEQMEILLLLRSHADRDWSAEEIAKELRIAAMSAGNRLLDLAGRGLLVPTTGDRFRYAPRDPALASAVEGLAKVYPERRVSVIEIIFSKPNDVIRTFADAFKLRRDK